jgi:hypothetical protein
MCDIIRLSIPSHISNSLVEYADKVIALPQKYTNNINNGMPDFLMDYDINDPNLPGINDEFIINHQLDTNVWGDKLLHKGILTNVLEISYPPMKTILPLINWLSETTSSKFIEPRGNFLYPQGGYMGWHTNSDAPGTRVYVAYSPKEHSSYFKYVIRSEDQPPQIITDWDDVGWTVRIFKPSDNPLHYLWHCIGAIDAPRISFGFMFE